ncbi:hypothetical protein [Xanthobacter sediminis]
MTASIAITSRTPFNAIPRPPGDWLSDALDTHLCVSPRVRDFHLDPCGDEKLALCSAPAGSVLRSVKLHDRILAVVAIPQGSSTSIRMRREFAQRLKLRNLLLVSESWLVRQPRLDIKSALVFYDDYRVARTDRLLIEQHLLDRGGCSCLADCAAYVLRDEDQVGAVLALVARGALRIDYARPLSVHSIISLPTRRHGGKLVIGG